MGLITCLSFFFLEIKDDKIQIYVWSICFHAVDLFCKVTLKTKINIIPDIISSVVDIAVLSESLHN